MKTDIQKRHEHQRVYWQAANEQAQQNHTRTGTDETRTILMHTLRSWRSIVGCDCCGKCSGNHFQSRPHFNGTPPTCTHGIPRDPA